MRTDLEKMLKGVRDAVVSLVFGIFIRILGRVGYPRASAWGSRVGRLVYPLFSKNRRRSFENITRVFGDRKTPEQREEMVKSLFENFSRSGFELIPYCKLPPREKKAYVRVVGKEKLDEALAGGRGVISLSAHLGNFLILMPRLEAEGYPVDFIVKRQKTPSIEERLESLRKELGYRSIYLDPKMQSVRASLRSLKQNHVLVLFGDQRQRDTGVEVSFLGLPARAATGPIALALSTGAPVVPMFMVRNPDGLTHTLFIDDPLELTRTGEKENDVRINVQKYTDVIQSYIRQYPAHWTWDHKRWTR